MAVREVPSVYKASDGKEFDTKEDAERHDAVVTAARKFREARHRLGRVLAEREKTADGHPFEFTVLGDYYYVSPGWGGMPGLSRVSFYVWSCEFEVDDEERVTIRLHKQTGPPYKDSYEEYRIRDLYRDERKAKLALLAAQEEWLRERATDVEKLREEVAPAPTQ